MLYDIERLVCRDISPQEQLNTHLARLADNISADLGLMFHIDPASHTVSIIARSGKQKINGLAISDLLDSPVKDVIWAHRTIRDAKSAIY